MLFVACTKSLQSSLRYFILAMFDISLTQIFAHYIQLTLKCALYKCILLTDVLIFQSRNHYRDNAFKLMSLSLTVG